MSPGQSLKAAIMENRPSRMLAVSFYEGLPIPVCGHYVSASSFVPWPLPSSPTPSLHDEILSFKAYMKPRTKERAQRIELLRQLSKIISTLEPGAAIESVGSFVTGLYLPTSDIDVVVKPSAAYRTATISYHEAQLRLSALQRALQRSPDFDCTIEAILSASVPLLRVTETVTGITIDMTFEARLSRAATEAVQEWETKLDATCGKGVFRALMLLVKQFLAMRMLSTTYTGGVNSYVLVWMVASYLQLEVKKVCPNLGEALKGFFKFWSDFEYETTAIEWDRVLGPCYEPKKHNIHQPYLLFMSDPKDPTIDMGKRMYAIKHVKESFAEAYQSLTMAESKGVVEEGGVLGTILGGNWDEFRRTRRKAAGKDTED